MSLLRIPIQADGSAGPHEAIIPANTVVTDDFAIDVEGNIWATTHPLNSVILIRPDGTIRLIHDHQDDIWGPTSAIFGNGPDDSTTLYIVTDGNLYGAEGPPWYAQSQDVMPALVLRRNVGVEGAPVPGKIPAQANEGQIGWR